jgi:hypothetical protein
MTHPITPPPELVRQWTTSFDCPEAWGPKDQWIASKAAQWGADRELDACCEWLLIENSQPCSSVVMRAARRPKPPSLKEQALEDLDELIRIARQAGVFTPPQNILRALKQLND